ncbi:putative pre-mrna splicing factor [Diplodia seriata]|uniref:Pre-mRNA-splicing factor n=1 Tax=Diplodia seriata TaxID=420778 RepID=A0A0G2DZV5_9PEZI|nr:putative pre-mrna splicing factor [Diplodia seriata]OMP88647.1 Pre-mRNA-splicing factor [Diplodia seriata]
MATPTPTNGLESVGQVPTGMIRPPKELHDTIEKTAGYVSRNGKVFIERLRANHRTNPKFSFVFEEDAFHPYFQWRIEEHRSGRGVQPGAGQVVGADGVIQQAKPSGPTEPPEFHYSARMPNINAQDLDVIKLTARFAAKNGRAFTTQLAQREASNSQFDFLRPQHSLNQFFNRLVEQYKELLTGEYESERKAQLEENVRNKFNMLEKAKARAEWTKYQEKQRQEKEQKDEDERVAYAEIDWHDFVVVETVLFTDADEQTELPPPTSLNDLQSASLEQKAAMSLRPHNMRIEEAMPDEDLAQWAQPSPAVQMPQPQVLPYQPQPQATYAAGHGPQRTAQEEEEERIIRERREHMERAQQAQAAAKAGPPQMKIRSDYVPRAQAKRKATTQVPCPNCSQLIDVDELEQHMKIELLDPQWKEQKAKADARFSTSNLSTQDVANNLKRLASQRDDIFDPTTGARITAEEEARRKRAATGYDGQPTNADAAQMAQMQGMNIQEQIRQIHQKFKQ